ncbi:hypothetical protein [Nonomuraea sp. B19D2]|uniref:hypothetical protein n=1 Tax=Nonomuraea sp. B19D2 TaxID=3159561 RepID=UPI0032DAFB6B
MGELRTGRCVSRGLPARPQAPGGRSDDGRKPGRGFPAVATSAAKAEVSCRSWCRGASSSSLNAAAPPSSSWTRPICWATTSWSRQETIDYLRHHLALAGRTDPLFTDDAAALIHTAGRGYPCAINNLAIQALLATFIADKTIVDESATRAAVNEVIATE